MRDCTPCLSDFFVAGWMKALDKLLHSSTRSETQGSLPLAPRSWYCIGSLRDVTRAPMRFELPGGQRFVAFRAPGSPVAVLSGRCCHMGADLSLGCVTNGRLACPLHGWEFAADGSCERIPAGLDIPPFARQTSFPVATSGGQVFIFNASNASCAMPFFRDVDEAHLLAARAFEFTVDAPWFLVSANGFDIQHFRCAHDRTLLEEPVIDRPSAFSCRLKARFRVTGDSLRDRLTSYVSGPVVQMTVENWLGNLVLVTAEFERTTTYGIVSLIPLDAQQTKVRTVVWAQRSKHRIARQIVDPLDVIIRRSFIREFMRADVHRSAGIHYDRQRMTAADNVLVDYLGWLQDVHSSPRP